MFSLKKLSCIFVFLVPFSSLCQNQYLAGYLVKKSGDTLKGYLKEDLEERLIKGVYYSANFDATDSKFYGVGEATVFSFENGNSFKSIKFNNRAGVSENLFAKFLIDGYYQLYSFYTSGKQNFVIHSAEDSIYHVYGDNLTPIGEIKEKGNYRNVLYFISRNCPSVRREVEGLKFTETTLLAFVKKLNKCVAPEVASKELYIKPKDKFNFYAYAGGIILGDKHQLAARILAKFTTPSVSNRLSLNIGLNYMQRSHTTKFPNLSPGETGRLNHVLISIPLTAQYNLLTKKIRPFIEAGLTIARIKEDAYIDIDSSNRKLFSFKMTRIPFCFALGIEGFVAKNLALKTEWRIEYLTPYPTIGVAYYIK